MRRECRERFPRHRLQRKPLVSDPGMHHRTCVTHVPWCMSGSLTNGGGEKRSRYSRACTTRNYTYLVRGPCSRLHYTLDCQTSSFCQLISLPLKIDVVTNKKIRQSCYNFSFNARQSAYSNQTKYWTLQRACTYFTSIRMTSALPRCLSNFRAMRSLSNLAASRLHQIWR